MKAIALREILTQLSSIERFTFLPKMPAFREADIQVDKLERMANEFSKKFRLGALGMSAKALTRTKGPELHRLTQQSKKVDSLFAKLFEQAMTQSIKEGGSKIPKKIIAAHCQNFVRGYNRELHKEAQRRQLSSGQPG
jgi:hypothetical protein